MYQILAYFLSNNATLLTDIPAIIDPNFSSRGGTNGSAHWIFTEPYQLVGMAAAGATITAAQLFDPTFNAVNIPQLYPPMLAIVPPTNPQIMDFRNTPIDLPMNEEIAMQISGGAGGAEPDYGLLWIKPKGDQNGKQSIMPSTLQNPRLLCNVTVTVALTAGVWSADAAITFVNPLRGGAYQVNGLNIVCLHGLAFRINFVKAPMYQGRKLLPGNLVETTYGNVPLRQGADWLGPMGRFNNFELPKLSILGSTTTGSATYTGYLDVTYLGNVGPDTMP